MATPTLPLTLNSAATASASVKAALPALTVMLFNGALNLLAAVLILIIGWTLSRWVLRWTRDGLANAQYVDATLKPLIAKFISYSILTITVVAVLGQFGVQTTSLIALLGAAGLAVGLALQGTLSNVASGVMLLVLRPFRVAERIQVGEVIGTTREIGLFRTTLVTDDGRYVSIPNSSIFSSTIINNSREKIRRTNFTLDIDHAEDIAQTRDIILAALDGSPYALKSPAPDVQVESLNGGFNRLTVKAWVKNQDFGGQQSFLRIAVHKALETAGINPPIPLAGVPQARTGQTITEAVEQPINPN